MTVHDITTTTTGQIQNASTKAAAILERAKNLCTQHATPQPSQTTKANVGIVLDATASRELHWKETIEQTMNVFDTLERAGRSPAMKLVFFADDNVFAGKWYQSAREMIRSASQIQTKAGMTCIEKSLRAFVKEHVEHPLTSIVFIGDSCEEEADALASIARRVKQTGARLFVFDDGERSTSRRPGSGEMLRMLAQKAGGAYATFDPSNMKELSEFMSLVGAHASGNEQTIKETIKVLQTPSAKALGQTILALNAAPGQR